jgi:hypothetical protein
VLFSKRSLSTSDTIKKKKKFHPVTPVFISLERTVCSGFALREKILDRVWVDAAAS